MHPKDADGSALFAQTCLSENLKTLQYVILRIKTHFKDHKKKK